MTWLGKILILSFAVFVSAAPKADFFDETVTFKFRSHAAKIVWQDGGFFQYLQQNPAILLNQFSVKDTDQARSIKVTLNGLKATAQLHLHLQSKQGIFDVKSKESPSGQSARLKLQLAEQTLTLAPDIDAYIINNNRKPLGNKHVVKIGTNNHGIFSFKLPPEHINKTILSAELLLPLTKKQFGHANVSVSQFITVKNAPDIDRGIAQQHFYDEQISSHASVYYAQNFEQDSWLDKLLFATGMKESEWQQAIETINQDEANFVDQKSKRSAKIPFSTKRNLANNFDFYFKQHGENEPEEAYFRYYLKLGENANISGGGKLPGFGGTYNKAGWGGRGNNGRNGWSARGGFFGSVNNASSPWQGHMPIGQYVYEVGKSNYGHTIPYGDELSTIAPGIWYCLEQRLKLNTPGVNDGIIEAWIDGKKIFSKNDFNFRTTPALKIEKIWFNFYFGGVDKPKHDFDLFIDNIVIASEYIGPLYKGN
ncbi:hypothetical protein DXX93_00720 [Thalassotalea euphylliae]|uniref:Polysaccharide lyase 14 domain-containing protein n=1 Tax=Thalassotalea euphylliae TaxID=1655234 RepID=A0A3E0TLB6_9GAMM|nr:hypothetical protein [Thalassotalea euphylliae]REL25223.1 hypothetical protein DXX93_00720 [Thalassotalea euphylliae]